MQVQHISYFQAHGLGLCHPGFWSKIGGSYAVDSAVGVGVSPWKTGWTRTLILWDYASWEADQREKSPRRRLMYFVGAPVPARGARTFDLRLRVSPNRDWQHLLAPYREHFRATFGAVRYDADYRWIASDYVNQSQQAISPENPYGLHGGHRRLDLAAGVEAFAKTVIPAITSAGGQGVILWGQGGDDPRGAMYRPDFDILPPEIERNWPLLAQRMHAAGLRLGVTARPADLALRLDWKQDQVIPINADDPDHREMLWRRFQKMIDRGCTLFYLDSFGAELEHVKLMRFLRERMGRKILTFTEHQCDAILPYSGGYSETTARSAGPNGPEYQVWSGVENWRIYQWLAPGAQLVSRLYQVEGQMPKDFEPVDEFFYRHGITPLVPVSDFARLPQLGPIQAKHLAAPAGRGAAAEKGKNGEKGDKGEKGEKRDDPSRGWISAGEKGDKGAKGEKGESDLTALAATWKTRADWTARAATIRQGILQAGGLAPLPAKSPLRPTVHSLRQHPGYSVANVAFESVPGFFVTGDLYRPLEVKGPCPAVLCPHGHFPEGRYRPDMQQRCATLARMGAVVFSYSMIGYNDSTQVPHNTPHAFTLQLWNSIRAVDFVSSLEGVDAKRIAVTGASGGGTQTFMLAAVDDRVAVSCPVVMVSSDFYGGCVCESGLPVHRGAGYATNNAEIAALAAPRPLLVVSDGKDWTKNVPTREMPYLKSVYRLFGAEAAVQNVHLADEGHDYGPSKRQAVYAFLARHLGLATKGLAKADGSIDESPNVIEPAAALAAFDAAHPRPADALQGEEAILRALRKLQH